jgi:hypothetical protein
VSLQGVYPSRSIGLDITGGLRRRWSSKPLNTFVEALEAFRTAISYRFVNWLTENMDVFVAYKASLGLIWA